MVVPVLNYAAVRWCWSNWYGVSSNERIICGIYIRVVICTDLGGKEPNRQVGEGMVVTPGKPTWCNGSPLTRNDRDVGSSPALGTIFPIFISPMTFA